MWYLEVIGQFCAQPGDGRVVRIIRSAGGGLYVRFELKREGFYSSAVVSRRWEVSMADPGNRPDEEVEAIFEELRAQEKNLKLGGSESTY